MGGELLTPPTQPKSNLEILEECCSFYLAIGMSYAEYWEGDPALARYYRKAYQIKQEEINNNAWLQGLYIYDAVSTAMHNALRDKKTRIREYAKQPYDFKNREKTEAEKAKELGWSGIRVNSVSPGVIDTRMNSHFSAEDMQALKEEIPMGRIGTGEDVAKAVLYLEENNYVTGIDLPVNGGFSIV